MPAFGQWQYSVDRDATAAAYARVAHGDAVRCGCNGCRNVIAARPQVFPTEFVALLESLGVDPTKEGEVYTEGHKSRGSHYYGGWFHFVGELLVTGDFAFVPFSNGLLASLSRKSAPSLTELEGLPLVQLEFRAENVPWVLSEQEPQ
jgi:hypothetical protein